MTKCKLKYSIVKDGKYFAIKAQEIELTTQGKTKDEAIKNLNEAYDLLMEKD